MVAKNKTEKEKEEIMHDSKIEWVLNPDNKTLGKIWNPITGCLNGCPYCYARKLANTRLKQRYLANNNLPLHALPYSSYMADPFYPRFWPERLYIPFNSKPKGIFTVDMGELFGDWIPREWQDDIFRVIKLHPNDRFYLLTKQPQNLAKFSPFPDNCWVGVSVCNDKMLDVAVDKLEDIQATHKYFSFEPLKERLSLSLDYALNYSGVSWLIIGAQTKPTVYPKLEWVEEIVKAADKAGIPVFIKNNLSPYASNLQLYPNMWVGDNDWDRLRQEMPEVKRNG